MKATMIRIVIAFLMILGLVGGQAHAQDMRQAQLEAQEARQNLMDKAAADKRAAEQAAAAGRAEMARDRAALRKAVDALAAQKKQLEQAVQQLETENQQLAAEEKALSAQLAESDGMVRELVGVVRINAKDLAALIDQNLQTAILQPDTGVLNAVAEQSHFPGMADLRQMIQMLRDTTHSSGEVSLQRAPILDRSGATTEAEVLLVGNFTAAYRLGKEVGFLTYAPAGHNLYALSRLPASGQRKAIARYMDGRSQAVPMDISRGGALRQLTHQLSLWQQIPKGGPIVWPILAILAIGIVIVIERVFFLWRRRLDVDGLMKRIAAWVVERKWDACQDACARLHNKPVARVVAAGLECRQLPREEMENVLQEAILREVPTMERSLATLAMLAAIAPLLGLLGTVTGMIDTFHVITQHGTGDPRMMSGGISEALVTTMLGLAVAIPIMLAHTLLNRSVDNQIGQMEEKAVALVNLVHKNALNAS